MNIKQGAAIIAYFFLIYLVYQRTGTGAAILAVILGFLLFSKLQEFK